MATKRPDLSKMDLDELKTLRKDVDDAIEDYETRRRRDALSAARAAAKQHGFSLDELAGTPKARAGKGRSVMPPKYRHPDDPRVTWSGRGRQPDWYKEALAKGAEERSLRIDQG